jgi:hypothetical protein
MEASHLIISRFFRIINQFSMIINRFSKTCLLTGLLLVMLHNSVLAQLTTVTGTVTDAKTRKAIPSASVIFTGTSYGTVTDEQGHFSLSAHAAYSSISVSHVGYSSKSQEVKPGQEQETDISLLRSSQQLGEVRVVSAKKKKYSNKNNPAVELIRQVIAHKKQNQPESYDYTEFRQYERMVFSLSNLSDQFKNRRITSSFSGSRIPPV